MGFDGQQAIQRGIVLDHAPGLVDQSNAAGSVFIDSEKAGFADPLGVAQLLCLIVELGV